MVMCNNQQKLNASHKVSKFINIINELKLVHYESLYSKGETKQLICLMILYLLPTECKKDKYSQLCLCRIHWD